MQKAEYRRLAMMLSMSFLIFLSTHQGSSLIWTGLEHLFVFLVLAILVLFVVDRSTRLGDAALTCIRLLALFVFAETATRKYSGEAEPQSYSDADPNLPWRFQLPPPSFAK